ncbi:MAG: efflux RND transporter permease subunit [Gammaproteobacteria bacterium]|jgi:multidrug efflux pump subunit AcrB|nr:efflux RND transporter permease subunit [Gammaproteobacteria bacterium]
MSSNPSTNMATGPIAFFATHKVASNLLMILMLMFGLFGMSKLNRQVMPDFTLEIISVDVEWPGASPQDVEENILEAIEPEVRFLDNVDKVQATAFEGRANINITFDENANMSKALTDVQSAVARITTFPADIESPVINQVTNADEVCKLEITGPFSEQALKIYARRIRDELLNRGLSKVDIVGGRSSEIWVEVPEATLRELDLSLSDISGRIGEASLDLPSGSVESGGRSRQIRSEGLARTPAEVGEIEIVSRDSGEKVKLSDVASINESFKENSVSRFHEGRRSIGLIVTRSPGQDSIEAQRLIEKYLDDVRPTLPGSLRIDMYDVFAKNVTQRIDMLVWNGFTGLLLVMGALYLFLNGRIAFWVAAGIPISIFMGLGCMYVMGITLNMISMFAIIMGLGIIVDDAIVVGERTETLHRRGMSPEAATLESAFSMFYPVLAASLTTIAAFFPLLMIGSVIGKVIGDLPVTIILIILASLIECFLILPRHLSSALTRMDATRQPKRNRFLLAFNAYRDGPFTRLLEAAYTMRYTVVVATFATLVVAVFLMISGRVGFEFFATPETNVVYANFSLSPGTPRDTTLKMVRELERAAYAVEDKLTDGKRDVIVYSVGSVATTEGRDGEAEAGGDHIGSFLIEFVPSDERTVRNSVFLREWDAEAQRVAGVENLIMIERSAGGPPGKDLDIRVTGGDLRTLKAAAMRIREQLRNISGVMAIEDNLPWGKQEIVLELTPAGRAMGFTTEAVARQVRNAFEGAIAKRFARDEEEVIVRVRLPKDTVEQTSIRDLFIKAPNGQQVPLTEVVHLETRLGFSIVRREDGVRQVAVTADVDKEVSTSNVVLQTFNKNYAADIEREFGVVLGFKGRAEEQAEASADVFKSLAVALATMYIILAWVFSSYRAPLIVMSIIPFGFIGAAFGHWAMGFNLGMFSIFALVGLAGVMVNDSIILVAAVRELLAAGKPMHEAVVQGTRDRLRPVILTTLTTMGGLIPLLFETSLQAQLVQPLAITLVFGMLFSPALVLLFVPALLGVGDDFVNRRSRTEGSAVSDGVPDSGARVSPGS